MNAAKKSYEPGPMYQTYTNVDEPQTRNERSRRFAKAAEDALNRDYGYNKTYKSGNQGSLSFSTPHDRPDYMYDDIMGNPYSQKVHFASRKINNDGSSISDVGPRGGWGYDDHTYKVIPDERFENDFRYGERVPKSDIYKGDTKFKDAIDNGESELNHYYNDEYEYQKGKGWTKK